MRVSCIRVRNQEVTYDILTTTRAIRNNHIGSTRLGIVGMQALHVDRSNSDRKNTVGIAIEVALVVRTCTVAASENKDRSLAATALLNAVYNGFFDERGGRLHRATVIWWAPGARVDMVSLVGMVKRGRLVGVRNGT